MIDVIRRGASAWAAAFLLLVAAATPAGAVPVTVFFTESTGMGVAESDVLAISSSFGIPILDPSFVGDADGVLSVFAQDLVFGSVAPSPPSAASGNQATSTWTIQNESSFDLLGDSYYVFATVEPFTIAGETVEYDPAKVGLSIDADLGWVFVRASDAGKRFYYAAKALGSLAPADLAAPFAVNYVIDEPVVRISTGTYVLPQLHGGMGFTPVPEPGTGLLLGLGLALLAGHRRLGA